MARSPLTEKPAENTRESIMDAALFFFARRGFDGTTVKNITDRAKVNASAISYHFAGKEGLYKACLESFGRSRLEIAKTLLQPSHSEEELRVRLGMFIEEFMACHMDQPDIVRVIHRECDLELPIAQDVFKSIFLEVFKTLKEFFATAKAAGVLRQDADTHIIAGCLFGSIIHMTRSDFIAKRYFNVSLKDGDYRKHVTAELLNQFLNGNLDRKSSRKVKA